MIRFFISKVLLFGGLILMTGAGLSAQDKAPELAAKKSAMIEITRENFASKILKVPTKPLLEAEQNGIRAARVINRKDLPGGPWATGGIGDFVLENGKIRVVVQGMNRSEERTDRAFGLGQIIDVSLEDQMWDQFGGLSQQVRIGNKVGDVVYGVVVVHEPDGPKEGPYLTAHGTIESVFNLPVVTKISLAPGQPLFFVETFFGNRADKEYPVRLFERINWGGLPIFVGGYGYPKYMTAIDDLNTHWICGQVDDFCLGMIKSGSEATRIARVQFNTTYIAYEDHVLKPQKWTLMTRTFLVTRGDMAPVSEYALKTKGFDYGFLQGTVVQPPKRNPLVVSGPQNASPVPLPGATVEVSMINPFKSTSVPPLPYAITKTDLQGRYRIALPEGDAAVMTSTTGRVLRPRISNPIKIKKGAPIPATRNINQSGVRTVTFMVVDAKTSETIPAKVRFKPLDTNARARAFSFGPPWKASGARDVFYLKPGRNEIPIAGGRFRCVFSRGPEYEVLEEDLNLGLDNIPPIKIGLRRLVPTDSMVSLALNLASEISPVSRVSAEDLVLAAAGEGLEWVFSGDLGEVTDLNQAIRAQGLQKWIRASGGVHLSYQHEKLFGEFYVFPVPLNTTKKQLAALAGPETTPKEFFAAVRKAFPGAIISVMDPSYASSSYLHYYGLDAQLDKLPTSKDFSWDFDALDVFGSRNKEVRRAGFDIQTSLQRNGHYKFPLAASRTKTLYFDEPGYPRIYLATGQNDAAKMNVADVPKALRGGKYFVTTGPIIEHTISEKWPDSFMSPPHGEFIQSLRVLGAPWVKVNYVAIEGLPLFAHSLMPGKKNKGFPDYVRFPYNQETTKTLHRKLKKDSTFRIQVQGESVGQVVTEHGSEPLKGFAFTPPVLLDGDGDGEYHYKGGK